MVRTSMDRGRRRLGTAHHGQVFFGKQGEKQNEEEGRWRRGLCRQRGGWVRVASALGRGEGVGRPPGPRPQGK